MLFFRVFDRFLVFLTLGAYISKMRDVFFNLFQYVVAQGLNCRQQQSPFKSPRAILFKKFPRKKKIHPLAQGQFLTDFYRIFAILGVLLWGNYQRDLKFDYITLLGCGRTIFHNILQALNVQIKVQSHAKSRGKRVLEMVVFWQFLACNSLNTANFAFLNVFLLYTMVASFFEIQPQPK